MPRRVPRRRPHAVGEICGNSVRFVSHTAPWEPLFLEAVSAGRSVAAATREAGIARRTAYDRRERDQHFAKAWDQALEKARLAQISDRTRRRRNTPGQLAARLRAVEFALYRCAGCDDAAIHLAGLARVRLADLKDEIGAVRLALERQQRKEDEMWQVRLAQRRAREAS